MRLSSITTHGHMLLAIFWIYGPCMLQTTLMNVWLVFLLNHFGCVSILINMVTHVSILQSCILYISFSGCAWNSFNPNMLRNHHISKWQPQWCDCNKVSLFNGVLVLFPSGCMICMCLWRWGAWLLLKKSVVMKVVLSMDVFYWRAPSYNVCWAPSYSLSLSLKCVLLKEVAYGCSPLKNPMWKLLPFPQLKRHPKKI